MKKILIGISAFLIGFTAFALAVILTPIKKLFLLNWGDYIDQSLVMKFENEYDCQVIEEDVPSSESMYQKITANTSSYDVAIPGDYMVHTLYDEGYLQELDVSNPALINLSQYQDAFSPDLKRVMEESMKTDGKDFSTYYIPYFWGAYALLYSKKNPEVGKVIEDKGFASLYHREDFSSPVKIGMYDSARWIVASYLLSGGKNPNLTDQDGSTEGDLSESLEEEIIQALKKTAFDSFGNDQLKRDVANGDLDFCYTQLGDFFDTFYLMVNNTKNPNVSFHVNIPKVTACFFDAMVIPKTAQNVTLANQFIDFMMDPENAYQNARTIGYCPTEKKTVALFRKKAEEGEAYIADKKGNTVLSLKDFIERYPFYLDPLKNSTTVYLLEPKSQKYLTTCETIFNSLA